MEKRRQMSIKLPEKEAEQLMKMAKKNNITITEQTRRYISKGLLVDAYQQDEARILDNTKTALKEILDPQVERLAKINAKNAITSSVNWLYTAFLVYQTAKPESRVKLEPVMDTARRLGISFVKLGKGSVDDFLRDSIKYINDMWEGG